MQNLQCRCDEASEALRLCASGRKRTTQTSTSPSPSIVYLIDGASWRLCVDVITTRKALVAAVPFSESVCPFHPFIETDRMHTQAYFKLHVLRPDICCRMRAVSIPSSIAKLNPAVLYRKLRSCIIL